MVIPDGTYKNKVSEFTIVKGKLEGEYISYWGNGVIALKCNYLNGVLHGEFFRFHIDGQIYMKRVYHMGIRQDEL